MPVNSSVLHINLEECTDDTYTPFNVSEINREAEFDGLVIPEEEPESSLVANVTATHSSGLIFHPFNVSKEPFAVQFNLYPLWHMDIFEVTEYCQYMLSVWNTCYT